MKEPRADNLNCSPLRVQTQILSCITQNQIDPFQAHSTKPDHSRKGEVVNVHVLCAQISVDRHVLQWRVLQPRLSVPVHSENGCMVSNPVTAIALRVSASHQLHWFTYMMSASPAFERMLGDPLYVITQRTYPNQDLELGVDKAGELWQ